MFEKFIIGIGLSLLYSYMVFIREDEKSMLIGLMQGIGIFYYWTWFIWPFVFVFSLVYAIVSLVKDDRASLKPILVASISLFIILAGITGPLMSP